jgi:hypothetical protein
MVLAFLVKFSWNYVLDIPEHIEITKDKKRTKKAQ